MRRCPNPERRQPISAGFTLVEIAVVIVVLSLLLAMIAGIATAMVGQQRREATRQRLAGVETALALYVSQNKRLPCPADGQTPGTAAGAGTEARNPANGACHLNGDDTQIRGVVPWRTVGLSELDVTDGWGNRLTYRVAPELARYPNNANTAFSSMDLTYCDPAGTPFNPPLSAIPNLDLVNGLFCRPDCTSATFPNSCTPPGTYLASKGLKVRTLGAPVTLTMNPSPPASTGAAYVVISHGENGAGAYNNQGSLQAGAVGSGTLEASNNSADTAFSHSISTTFADADAFVDDFPVYAEGAGHFDDILLRPSILAVATKAQLGPRAH